MKLTWDVFVVLIKAFATLVLGMTLMAAGAALWSKTKKASENIGPTLEELRITREQAKQALEEAKQKRDESFANEAQVEALKASVESATTHIQKLRNEISELKDDAKRAASEGRAHSDRFSLNLATWENTNQNRNDVFLNKICNDLAVKNEGKWNSKDCRKILDNAKVTPSTASDSSTLDHVGWHARVHDGLETACDGWKDQAGDFFSNHVLRTVTAQAAWEAITGWRSCDRERQRVELMLAGFGEFLTYYEKYHQLVGAYEAKEKNLEEQKRKQEREKETLDGLLRERLEASIIYANAKDAAGDAYTAYNEAMSNPRVFVQNLLVMWWEKARPYFFTVLGVLLAMVLWRPLIYFCIAPLAGKLPSVGLLPRAPRPRILRSEYAEAESETPELSPPAHLRVTADQRKQLVYLKPNEKLWVRPDYVVSSRGGGAQWIYGGWQHPFTSYAAGLVGMTVFDGSKPGQDRGIAIAGTGEAYANAYITRVELTNHPGFVLRTSHVVAMQGQLKIRARWSFQPVSLLRGQVRYMVAEGTGSIYFVGYGGAFPHTPSKHLPFNTPEHAETAALDDRHGFTENMQAPLADAHANDNANTENVIHQLHDGLVIGWDARLEFGLERNENWIDVAVRRRSAMFESSFKGEGIYITTNAVKTRSKDVAGRMLEAILGTLGKILGI